MARKQQMFDFEDGNGPVPAHQHKKGGGWVANTAYVAPTACVGPIARVYGRAGVHDFVEIHQTARVRGVAQLWNDVLLFGDSEVEDAELYHQVRLYQGVVVRGRGTVLMGDMDLYSPLVNGPLVIDATPIIVTSDYPHPVVMVKSPQNMVSVGCVTHPLTYWRKNLRLIAQKDTTVSRKLLQEFRRLLDAVYGPAKKM